jgi:uncharacterized protein YqeY
MSSQKQVDEDIKAAMKARETEKLAVLRMLKAALKNAAIEKGGANSVLDDAEVMAVVRKQVKQRQDSIQGFEKGNRPELAEKEKAEVEVLISYLPKALTESEIDTIVKDSISETGATSRKEMGAVMKIASRKAAGRVDGRTLSQAVQKALS